MFEKRRPAAREELERLYESWGIPSMNEQLAAAEISELVTLSDLGAQHTVIAVASPAIGAERVHTVAELHASWSAGGGDPERDQRSYQYHLTHAAHPDYMPVLVFEPTASTSSGWWMLDGTHRAVALYTARLRDGTTRLHLPVFVAAEPLTPA